MVRVHIVTDSGARFSNPRLIQHYPVTILPNQIDVGGKLYREDIDLNAEEALRLISTQDIPPKVVSPSVSEFAEVYSRLSHSYDAIISIHPSRELFSSWQNAKIAAQQFSGRCEIVVIDSHSFCAGQGMLVRVVSRSIQQQLDLEQIIKEVRGAVERIYSVYYVDSLDYLYKNKIMSESHVLLGAHLGVKPFLSIEEGRLIVIEKVRTRAQAVDRLVEFLIEFVDLEDAVILQHRSHMSEQTRMLQDRLVLEFPGRHFPYTMYSATLASLIGTHATGVAVLEGKI